MGLDFQIDMHPTGRNGEYLRFLDGRQGAEEDASFPPCIVAAGKETRFLTEVRGNRQSLLEGVALVFMEHIHEDGIERE